MEVKLKTSKPLTIVLIILFTLLVLIHLDSVYDKYVMKAEIDFTFFVATKLQPIYVLILCAYLWKRGGSESLYAYLIIASLLISSVGDVYLAFTPPKRIPGIAAFAVAQILYAVAFSIKTGGVQPNLRAWIAIPYIALGFGVHKLIGEGIPPSLSIPIVFYIAVIMIMCFRATARLGTVYPGFSAGIASCDVFAFLGAIAFVVSDLVLAYGWFIEPFKMFRMWNMGTYFVAQFFMAASVMWPIVENENEKKVKVKKDE